MTVLKSHKQSYSRLRIFKSATALGDPKIEPKMLGRRAATFVVISCLGLFVILMNSLLQNNVIRLFQVDRPPSSTELLHRLPIPIAMSVRLSVCRVGVMAKRCKIALWCA